MLCPTMMTFLNLSIYILSLLVSESFCERYGIGREYCLDGTKAEKTGSGVVKWCDNNEDCSKGWECLPSGHFHFSKQISYCCQLRESICSMPPNPGYGDCFEEPKTKYYFDSLDLKCKKFKVISCHPTNQNQFESYEMCMRFCQSTACLAGQSLLLARDSTPISCQSMECPIGYRCVFDKLFNKHVCCGHSPTGVCPIGSVSYSTASTNQPLRCIPSSLLDSCPADYICTTQGLHSFCCTPNDAICPAGQQPYIHTVSKNTMKCNPLESSSCPSTYYCSPAIPGAYWGFCCSVHIEASCPAETKPYLDYVTQLPVRCTVGVTQCNVGYSCQSSQPGSIIGFCCTIPKITLTIQPNFTPADDDDDNLAGNERNWFVHNEGFVNPMMSHQSTKPSFKSIKSTYGISSSYKPAVCPPFAKNVYYPNTQINIECTPAYGYEFNCPSETTCTQAYLDMAGRQVCCEMPKTTQSPGFIYYVTSIPRLIRYQTTDQFCPYAIRNLRCHPSRSRCPMGILVDHQGVVVCSFFIQPLTFHC
ncbi:unnamed protein product [Caenorhabditis bovis]|uniref:BPTI/Kunitz inhibitor domain-containing protein n=1 Tax=Caenorhabditis bovis TaxID=2654633 RepID=A0A8S1EK11_9PELO|nr:unnamed protein product [Caenorhabditis bovis]